MPLGNDISPGDGKRAIRELALLVAVLCIVIATAIILKAQPLGCSLNESFELVDSGNLTQFERGSEAFTIVLDNRLYTVSALYYDKPLIIGGYYYLYRDTIGGVSLAKPYKLTQSEGGK